MLTLVKKHFNNTAKLSKAEDSPKQKFFTPRPVTAAEFCQVNFVTIREGVNHCRWPREVIEQFLLAEV